MTTMEPLVIYHGNCADGFTAAWVAHKALPTAEFVAGVYGQPLPSNCAGRTVYLLDFSYKQPVMEQLAAQATDVVVLDHHQTAEGDLGPLLEAGTLRGRFNMHKSGARLAWEWFFPTERVPMLVAYVEDRDLWRFSLPDSRSINASIFSHTYDFSKWDDLAVVLESDILRGELAREGVAIERKHHKDIAELLVRTMRSAVIGGVRVLTANMPYTMASDAAHALAEPDTFGATYYIDTDGYAVYSLRSHEIGMDCAQIAQQYGGGGHKHAAGFRSQVVL